MLPMKLLDWIDPKKIDWIYLSANPNAIEMIKKNPKKINWIYLSANKNAIQLLKENENNINWYYLTMNESEDARHLSRPGIISFDSTLKNKSLECYTFNLSILFNRFISLSSPYFSIS